MSTKTLRQLPYLDHGYVVLRNVSGPTRRDSYFDYAGDQVVTIPFDADDVDPANAARMSFDQTDSGRTRQQDLALADYLMRNWHTSPFEMVEVWVEMKLPIVIARQVIRHRTSSVNEVSGRYVQLPAEWYIPKLEDVVIQTPDKKQGGRPVDLLNADEVAAAQAYLDALEITCANSYRVYQEMIAKGIALEQARFVLHLNHYTHWLWKQDLHNLMHLMSLRLHSHAQAENRKLAQCVYDLLVPVLPNSMRLFDKYRRRE